MNIQENKTYASESFHWYDVEGNPRHEMPKKDGSGMRPTTLADARKLNLLPSVTSILSLYPRPYLQMWQKKQVLMSALTLTRLKDETDDALIARIMADADEQARIAREKGTAIHGAIERFICGLSTEVEYSIYVQAVLSALKTHLEDYAFLTKCKAEKSFASEVGYGGRIDIFSRELGFIADIKTSEFDDLKKVGYQEHLIQLSAYGYGLNMLDARLLNVYVSTKVPGLVKIIEYTEGKEEAFEIFKKCFELWCLIKKYSPRGNNVNNTNSI